jgi:hypothetical protein
MSKDESQKFQASDKTINKHGIRAIRFLDSERECEARLEAFGMFAKALDAHEEAGFALRIARALRAERRASQGGNSGYDPMRHLVLSRLSRRLKRKQKNSHGAL